MPPTCLSTSCCARRTTISTRSSPVTGNQIVGVVSFERVTDTSAEIAVLVDDAAHHQGIGTLLVEYLASLARRRGITRFVAEICRRTPP
jgi:GNAT superfamily N-acetyltransferase